MSRLRRLLFGEPRNVEDPKTYHSISLIALLAWVGLGADGLSSSAYGPDEAFRALGPHTYLAVALAAATAFTVCVFSYAYSRIIEHFPYGGGGYIVATKLLGRSAGVVSGSALLVDYVLTISVSIASASDQIFSVLPHEWHGYKLLLAAAVIGILVMLNLRGVKESVTVLAPIFGTFVITHAILIGAGIASHTSDIPRVASEVRGGFAAGLQSLGWMGVLAIFFRAYAMGGGTYTGIEAVSNGLAIMREPKVQTGQRTMFYMALSLAVTASGILVCYLLFKVMPEQGKTMNAVLLESFAGAWRPGGLPLGHAFVVLSLAAEAGLLFVAAQAGFIDGPRVMANMAHDSWLPHRFAQLSDRLTIQDGVLLIGGAALATLFYTGGNVTALVTMYSINVFLTFSLTQASMCRFWLRERRVRPEWLREIVIHVIGFALASGILIVVVIEKFHHGGWVTLAVTSTLVALCYQIRRHYGKVLVNLKRLDDIMTALPTGRLEKPPELDPELPTAVMLVGPYGGLGIHAMLTVGKLFPRHFKNFIFVSVGVIDSATQGAAEVERARQSSEASLRSYVELAQRLGMAADYRMGIAIEVIEEAERLCTQIAREFPRAIFFANKLVFEEEHWYQRLLHNETAYQIQRRFQFAGLNAMVLPVRVFAVAGQGASPV